MSHARAHANLATSCTPTEKRAMASSAGRVAALIRGIEVSANGDSGVIAGLYTDDVQGCSPVMDISSAAELAIEIEDRDGVFADIELVFAPLDVAGEQACVEWTMTATHSGPLNINDDVCIDASGVRLTVHGVTVAEFDGDRICRFRDYWDEANVLAQITAGRDE
jgi:hypothetical protein